MGDYARAEPLCRQAMEIREKALGKQHPSYARSMNNLAALYESVGDYPHAAPLFRQAIEIQEKALGKQHPHYAQSLYCLAGLYESMGDYPRAEPLYVQAMEISLRSLEQTASVQTESQQLAMSQSLRYQLDNSIRCGLAMDP